MNSLKELTILLLVVTVVSAGREIAVGSWIGVGAYMLVDAKDAQARLDEYAASTPGAPQLYVPLERIFSNIPDGKHVVYMDFGFETTSDLAREYTFLPKTPLFWVNLPYLSSTPGGDPHYHISLASFYTPPDEDLKESTTKIFPIQVADELTISDSSLYLRSCGEEIHVNFTVFVHCQEPPRLYLKQLDAMTLRSSLLGTSHFPNLHFCAPPPYTDEESSYCCVMEDIRNDVQSYMPNVCTTHQSPDEKACVAKINETRITKGFRDVMLLGDGPITVIASEIFRGNYTIGLQYPCVQ